MLLLCCGMERQSDGVLCQTRQLPQGLNGSDCGRLFGFLVNGVLVAESAMLLHFESIGVIFLVLLRNIVSALAFCASKCDFNTHCFGTSC